MDKWFVIVNPNAGGGLGKKVWKQIHDFIEFRNIKFEFKITEHKEHAIDLTQKIISSGYKQIISVGGDGTVNEIVNGIIKQNSIPANKILLAMIPIGTGNDWRRSLAIPKNYKETIDLLIKKDWEYHDLAEVSFNTKKGFQSRYFINMAGIGFDALVAKKSNEDKIKGKNSKLLYLKNVLSTLISYKNINYCINYEKGMINDKVFSLSIGKGKFNGGGMMQCPNAVINDGLLDFTVIKNVTKFEVIKEILKIYSGKHINHPKIETIKTKKLKIQTDETVFLEIDGETMGYSPFTFSIIPKLLKVIVNKTKLLNI